ncbi:MAG: SRPBCC family protein [Pseudomonadota bacterium]
MNTALIIMAAVVFVGLLIALTPNVIEYVETVKIRGSQQDVYDAIRFQSDLMQWSAWPAETDSACRQVGTDGEVGATTEFIDKKGKLFGHQTVSEIAPCRFIRLTMTSKGPPHVPLLDFHILPEGERDTKVLLHFRNTISRPFHVILRLAGVVKWTREMHLKDLDGLKRFIERSEDYAGRHVTR